MKGDGIIEIKNKKEGGYVLRIILLY